MNDRALHPIVSRPLQARFLTIPQAPLCYWLRERFLELLAGRTLGDVADVIQGLATGENDRFIRFPWEVAAGDCGAALGRRRWVQFEKGGGYAKWYGHHFWALDWEHDGARMKATPGPRVQNEQHYFRAGWTYSGTARGSLGLRMLTGAIWYAVHSDAVIAHENDGVRGLGSVLNSRMASASIRWLRPQLDLSGSYVARVPLPEQIPASLAPLESTCIALKRYLVALDPTERTFELTRPTGASLVEAWRRVADDAEAVAAVLHTLEGVSDREVFKAYGIEGDDLTAVLDETGTPAGWFPVITGYDAIPALPPGLDVPASLLAPLSREPRRTVSAEELADLKRRLRALYEAGPGATVEDDEVVGGEDNDDEESEPAASGARIPIPAETLLEELSQKLEVHSISVCWLLRELRDKDGAVCKTELQRFVADYVSVLVLRLLGHRWPREVGGSEPPPAWVDGDGVIALTDGTGGSRLLARIRDRLAEDFDRDRVGAIEREFEEVVGRSLGVWLAAGFFKRHPSQFRKRPIAWQIVSSGSNNERRRGRGASRRTPAFACLVYYHRLDADLLPKLRAQYVGPLRASFQTEMGSLAKIKERSAEQDARRLELEEKLEELKAFDARLEQVIVDGFAAAALDEVAAKQPLDTWTSRDGQAPSPATPAAFLAQERRYDPDLNDGVRVNIAPLQRAGLLAADVLAAKDIEKAIVERAEWRADERRWCREGKLPQPGWWGATGDRR